MRSAPGACRTRCCSPGRAASGRPRSRASSRAASTARRARPTPRAAPASPAARSPRAARPTCRRSTRRAAPPSTGKHRIFVVDEVHMLSAAAFNALLKTLEEPPPRSLFVFATTNPEKIPFTVLSRCQRYDLRRIAAREIVARLRHIAATEGIEISDASLLAIAREADGSLRDAQTLLDQVISFDGTKVDDAHVAQVLDLIDRRVLLAILEACVAGDAAAALEAAGRAALGGAEAKRLGEVLLQMLRDLVVLRLAPNVPDLIEGSDEEIA